MEFSGQKTPLRLQSSRFILTRNSIVLLPTHGVCSDTTKNSNNTLILLITHEWGFKIFPSHKGQLNRKSFRTSGLPTSYTCCLPQELGSDDAAAPDSPPTLCAEGVLCCGCGKTLPRRETLYQAKSSRGIFCSASCLSERHPDTVVPKNCFNCFQ